MSHGRPKIDISRPGIIHDPRFLSKDERGEVVAWLKTIHPLWEFRHGSGRILRDGQTSRRLLRPVYWLGGWQFASLGYYHPPEHVRDRVVLAEPIPPVLAAHVAEIERRTHAAFAPSEIPAGWRLNTCLVNFYGLRQHQGRWVDSARLGGHQDYEPGPVAALSLGAKARFQFTTKARGPIEDNVALEHWLEDRSLLVFGGRWKDELFHRVPHVAREGDRHRFGLNVKDFRTRRVSFTFRYVPDAHLVAYRDLSEAPHREVERYINTLAAHSPFFGAHKNRGSIG